MTKVLQITNYPTRRPRHGGQIRASQTAKQLEAAGFQVQRAPIFIRDHYRGHGELPALDLGRAETARRFPEIFPLFDLTTAELAAIDPECFAAFDRIMNEAAADIILLEEPWLWPALRRWRLEQKSTKPVIFNAYNIEYRSKAAMLEKFGMRNSDAAVSEIEALERDLASSVYGLTTTTEADAEVFRAWTTQRVEVAANGTTPQRRSHLRGVLPPPLEREHKFVVFVASAHPPNAEGFADLVLPALNTLRSHERIVVAGGVAQLIAPMIQNEKYNYRARDRLILLGPVSDLALNSLYANASGIILPITAGGGSNLKTAEALVSDRSIVGTSVAFRGFEKYMNFPMVKIADDGVTFAGAIRSLFDEAHFPLGRPPMPELFWSSTLLPQVRLVEAAAGASVCSDS